MAPALLGRVIHASDPTSRGGHRGRQRANPHRSGPGPAVGRREGRRRRGPAGRLHHDRARVSIPGRRRAGARETLTTLTISCPTIIYTYHHRIVTIEPFFHPVPFYLAGSSGYWYTTQRKRLRRQAIPSYPHGTPTFRITLLRRTYYYERRRYDPPSPPS